MVVFSAKERDMDVAVIQNRERTDVTAQVQVPTADDTAARREVVKAVKAVNQAELYGSGRELTYSIDRDTRKLVTKLVDKATGEVVNQIPAEYVLRLAEEYKQKA